MECFQNKTEIHNVLVKACEGCEVASKSKLKYIICLPGGGCEVASKSKLKYIICQVRAVRLFPNQN